MMVTMYSIEMTCDFSQSVLCLQIKDEIFVYSMPNERPKGKVCVRHVGKVIPRRL